MVKAWVYYLDGDVKNQVLATTQTNDLEQLKHNGMCFARYCYPPGTQLVFDHIEILESIN